MAGNNTSGGPRLDIEISVSGMAKTTKEFSTLHKQLQETEIEFKKANATALGLESELKSLSSALSRGAISQKAFNREQKEISVALSSARQSAQQYQARISSLNATLAQGDNIGRQYGNSAKTLQGVHDSVSKGIRGATTVSLELSRVLQDLPYGIQGVANNLQQVTTNLGYYTNNIRESLIAQGKQATTMNVTKALLGGLLSPMSLVTFGVSALTAGWVLYDKHQQKANKSTKETEESLRSYIDTLKGVARAQADGQANALKELTTVDQLYKATQNLSLPMSERLRYAKELVKTGGELFSSTSAEAIVAGEASSAYDKLTVSIQQTAMAQAFMQKMTDNATKALNNNLQILNEANEIQKLNQQIQRTQATLTTTAAGGVVGASSAAEYKTIARLEQQRSDRVKNITDLNKQNSEVLKEQDMLQKGINNSLEKGGKLVKDDIDKGTQKVKDNTKEIASLTNGILRDGLNYYDAKLFDINQKYSEIYSKITDPRLLGLARINEEAEKTRVTIEKWSDSLDKFSKSSRNISLTGTPTLPSGSIPQWAIDNINRPITSNLTDEFSKQFTSTLRRGLASTFNDLFSNISNLSESAYEIEKKYADLRANATAEQIEGLNKMEALERKINNGLTNMLSKLGGTFTSISGNVLSSALSNAIADPKNGLSDLKKMFSGDNKMAGYGSVASLLGGALGSVFKPSDTVGQSLSGALAGLGSGVAIGTMIGGPLGTILGGVGGALIGGLSSLFGASRRKREEELMELQLAEQRKLVALSERQAALAYTSSIIGQMTNQGYVSSVDRSATGDLLTRINGKDIELVLERTKSGRG